MSRRNSALADLVGRVRSAGERSVPPQVVALWNGPATGLLLRAALALVFVPLVLRIALARNPSLGVILSGLIIGALYGLIAVGLILVYRANHIINFAQAGLGVAPALAGYLMYRVWGVPYALVVLFVLVSSAVLAALTDLLIVQRFSRAPRMILTVATLGILQLLTFLQVRVVSWMGVDRPPQEFPTPFSGARREIGGATFKGDHLVALAGVVIAVGLLAVFLLRTRVGIAVRAAAEDGDRAQLLGIPVRRLSTIVWAVTGLLSGVGAFLRAPLVGVAFGGGGFSVVLYALAIAVFARMESIPAALAGGMVLGVVDQAIFFSTRNAAVSQGILLPLIILALVINRKRISRTEVVVSGTWENVREFRPIPARLLQFPEVALARNALYLITAALVLAAPFIVGEPRRNLVSLMVVYAIIGVSVVILTGWTGQISLGQFAFTGVGAAVAGSLISRANIDFFLAVFAAGVVGALLATVVGLPALRVRGLYLAVTTLAFAVTTQSFLLNEEYVPWLLPDVTDRIIRPVLYGRIDVSSDTAFFYVCLAFLVLAIALARNVRSSRFGRLLIGSRDNTWAAQSFGVNVTRTRLAAFAVSGFFAGLAGGLHAHIGEAVDPSVYQAEVSLTLFAMTVIGGLTSVSGAMVGSLYIVAFQYLLPSFAVLASGAGMLLVLMLFPGGLVEVGVQFRDAALRWVARRQGVRAPSLIGARRLEAAEEEGRSDISELQSKLAGPGKGASGETCPTCGRSLDVCPTCGHAHELIEGNGFVAGASSAGASARPSVRGNRSSLLGG